MFTTAKPLWPRACVFDCDGLLVASNGAWESAYVEIARELGHERALNLGALLGASVASAAEGLTRQLGRRVSPRLVRERLHDAFDRSPPRAMPGAHALLERLAPRLGRAVASNGPAELVRESLRQTELLPYFGTVVCAESVARPKPAPDVYVDACRRLGVHPSDAIGLEDSLVGARAAVAAGLTVVGVGVKGAARAVVDVVVGELHDPVLLQFLGLERAAG